MKEVCLFVWLVGYLLTYLIRRSILNLIVGGSATLTALPPWLHATHTISFGFHGSLFGRGCLSCIYCFMVMGISGIQVGLDVLVIFRECRRQLQHDSRVKTQCCYSRVKFIRGVMLHEETLLIQDFILYYIQSKQSLFQRGYVALAS